MRFVALLTLAALVIPMPFASSAQQHAEKPALASGLVRVTFVVRDLERSRQFYQEAFGYRVRFEGDISSPPNRALLNLKSSERAQFVVLENERTFSGRRHETAGIGLLAIAPGRTERVRHPRGNNLASGQPMLAVETSDIAAVIERLRVLKAPILAGPQSGRDGRETEIVTSDPDGTRIHVVEQRP
jgi:catechol 2,3-dioxygenase-like lactoylglutathione lyase family enzyme